MKEIKSTLTLQIRAGQANPAPPIGPALGQHGINIQEFCTKFNEATKEMGGDIIITGHSHHPMKIEIDGALFLNSGTRVAGRQDFALLDTATREYEVYKAFDSSSQN